jgi:hypothetical protein
MKRLNGLRVFVAAAWIVGAGLSVTGQNVRQDARSMREKVETITAQAERPTLQVRRTTVTEQEVNAFLLYDTGLQLPAGVVEPAVTIVGPGRVSARALVDLDAVRREKSPTSFLDPTYYLTGKLPVTATGLLRAANGVGRVEIESAAVGNIAVPKLVLQEIVSYYSRTPENPRGIGLDDPFALPAKIREIQVQRGLAIVIQ